MERNFSYEQFPGNDPEHESTPEKEQTEAELLLKAFENGKRFDDEDEKARDYNARLDRADEFQEEIDEISEQISQATSQLASLPLTYDQQVLLDMIEKLMAQRRQAKKADELSKLDDMIEAKTKELAGLPVTGEQGVLLDKVLELIDAREATSVKLREVFERS
ncbi:MAG TPA: hypothetical protein VGE34_04295 [Candidatus Saccharimonadales bacterium]